MDNIRRRIVGVMFPLFGLVTVIFVQFFGLVSDIFLQYIANVTQRTFEIVPKNRDPANIIILLYP